MMLKTIDLFAGAGGLSLGFKMTGQFELVAAAEINANAKATYKKNLVGNNDGFTFIDNVVGYDFAQLSEKVGGIDCPTAHCERYKPHFDFGDIPSPIVPHRNKLQTQGGMTAH